MSMNVTPPADRDTLSLGDYLALIWRFKNVVILAHGASILLAGKPGVLRVLVTASPATRAGRVAAEAGTNERQATREIQHSDRERKSFFKRFHNLDEELPTHYDLVVNTDVLSSDASAHIIAHAATSA